MIRSSIGQASYWSARVAFDLDVVIKNAALLREPSKNPEYDPQFSFNLAKRQCRLLLRRYSRGDPIGELGQHFPGLLDAWELSNKLADELKARLKPGEGWDHRQLLMAPQVRKDPRAHNDPRAWVFELSNLNHYNWCFWLVGLALVLEIPNEQWSRLLALIDGEGQDVLLDRVIASRESDRTIGTRLLHPKPYARLLAAIDAPAAEQALLLRDFVENWYPELERKGRDELWWYIFGDPVKHPLEMGSYFGRWCIEAAAAVKAFGLDDTLCLGLENYPGDLLRPEGPSTHVRPAERVAGWAGWLSRLLRPRR